MKKELVEFAFSMVEKALFKPTPGMYRRLYSLYKRISDKPERDLCRRFIHPGMTVVDVGANIGMYTEFFCTLVGSEGEVHAFEPDPVNFRLLSLGTDSLDNVYLNRSAVGETTRDIFLYRSSALNVDHRTYDCEENRARISVSCIALDDYFMEGKAVDFVKMDIQGYEYNALKGMKRLLQDNSNVRILLEYFPTGLEMSGSSGTDLQRFLEERGFSLFHLSGNGNLVALNGKEPPLNSLGYTNVFAQRV